jgi:hypothetical protein
LASRTNAPRTDEPSRQIPAPEREIPGYFTPRARAGDVLALAGAFVALPVFALALAFAFALTGAAL